MLFDSKYAKEVRGMIAEYKAKYGTPRFDPSFTPTYYENQDETLSNPKFTGNPVYAELLAEVHSIKKAGANFNKDAVQAYTSIGQRAISAMSIIEDVKMARLIWEEEHHFFESAQDYALLCSAIFLWCRKKGAKEAFIHNRQIKEWQNQFGYNGSSIVLVPYWEACGMDVRRLQDEWGDLYEKEALWYVNH